jgi:hypothetical protein
MTYISSGSSLLSSMQTWQAKQKAFTSTFLDSAAVLADDIGSSTLTLSQNMATFATQQAYDRIVTAGKAKAAANTATSTVDPYAGANAAKKVEQMINGTDKLVANTTSTTDAGKTVNQIINGTTGMMATGSNGDVTKTINQIVAGTDKVTTANQSADMMTLTKIMYNIDKLPLPPKVDVAS